MIMRINSKQATASATEHGVDGEQDRSIIQLLIAAYNAEIETLANYIANANNIDGIRAERIREELLGDVTTELGHAQQLAKRIRVLGGSVPGSLQLHWEQEHLQPPDDSLDLISVIKGVIVAEEQAISLYEDIIKACEGVDYATQDLAIDLLADEQEHRRQFVGFLREFDSTPRGVSKSHPSTDSH